MDAGLNYGDFFKCGGPKSSECCKEYFYHGWSVSVKISTFNGDKSLIFCYNMVLLTCF